MSARNEITVDIQVGPEYRGGARVAAAIQELQDALQEAHSGGDEVAGFAKYDGIGGESDDAVIAPDWPVVDGNRVFRFSAVSQPFMIDFKWEAGMKDRSGNP